MAFFTRILDFKRTFLAKLRDKRVNPRYPVGSNFPLSASLLLSGDGAPAKKDTSAGLSWSGPLGNISSHGLSVYLAPAAQTTRGEETVVRLTLGGRKLDIPCSVAHFRVYGSHSICGVQLNFKDFSMQKSFHQIVESVSVGSSFAPTETPAKKSAGLLSQQWRSINRSVLTEWRQADTRKLERFELAIGEHKVEGQANPPMLTVLPRGAQAKSAIAPAVATEVREFFGWVTGNMPKNVPADLRELITRLLQSRLTKEAWAAPVKRT